MMTVNARQANQQFSQLLSRVERGEEVLITKRGKAVAVLMPPRPPQMTKERNRAIVQALRLTAEGLPWGADLTARGTARGETDKL